jgi:hypothetical protein
MLRDFFQPLKDPVEKYWDILPLFLFISLVSWIVTYLTKNFLMWLLLVAISVFIYTIIYCLIKKSKK